MTTPYHQWELCPQRANANNKPDIISVNWQNPQTECQSFQGFLFYWQEVKTLLRRLKKECRDSFVYIHKKWIEKLTGKTLKSKNWEKSSEMKIWQITRRISTLTLHKCSNVPIREILKHFNFWILLHEILNYILLGAIYHLYIII